MQNCVLSLSLIFSSSPSFQKRALTCDGFVTVGVGGRGIGFSTLTSNFSSGFVSCGATANGREEENNLNSQSFLAQIGQEN